MNFVEEKKLSHMGASHELIDIAFFLQLFSNQPKQKWRKKSKKQKKQKGKNESKVNNNIDMLEVLMNEGWASCISWEGGSIYTSNWR